MTNNPKSTQTNLDFRAVLDGLGQGVLLFGADDRLVLDNLAARSMLGANLTMIRSEGWPACVMLLDSRRTQGPTANEARALALRQPEPVRFFTLLAGAYIPCWASAIYGSGGVVYTMITLEQPDWKALEELTATFRNEASMAISSTRGHAELIIQMLKKTPPNTSVAELSRRVTGFAEIMATHMHRLERLMISIQRLEIIRTNLLVSQVKQGRKKLKLDEFIEDYLEELADEALLEPTHLQDFRDRLTVNIPASLLVAASPVHLKNVLSDLLRNAVLYSPAGSPLIIQAHKAPQGKAVQLDVIDQGYGIRAREADKVFTPFQRARQPQIIGEFGYGISLYLAKAEIEAMGGRIWYESEENNGTTFSIKLPIWQDVSDDEDEYSLPPRR